MLQAWSNTIYYRELAQREAVGETLRSFEVVELDELRECRKYLATKYPGYELDNRPRLPRLPVGCPRCWMVLDSVLLDPERACCAPMKAREFIGERHGWRRASATPWTFEYIARLWSVPAKRYTGQDIERIYDAALDDLGIDRVLLSDAPTMVQAAMNL
jgi:hypothetical protein